MCLTGVLSIIKFLGGNRKPAARAALREQNTPQEAQVRGDRLRLPEPGPPRAMPRGAAHRLARNRAGSAPRPRLRAVPCPLPGWHVPRGQLCKRAVQGVRRELGSCFLHHVAGPGAETTGPLDLP